MVNIMSDSLIGLKMAPGAFSGELICPWCNATGIKKSSFRFVEKATPTRFRYQCKDCHKTILYDVSFREEHPYEAYTKKSRFREIVDEWKSRQNKS